MVQLPAVLRLQQAQTNNIINRDTYPPGLYTVPLLIEGNSLFSSVWVKSMDPGASVVVRYYETTTGDIGEERVNTFAHPAITNAQINPTFGYTHQGTVTPFHNKPVCEVEVLGGDVYFGVYVTVVDTFATDLDAALKYDGQPVDLVGDKALPIAVLDRTTGQYLLWGGANGVPLVKIDGIKNPVTTNITLPDELTEETILLPVGTTAYTLRSRSGAPLKIATTSGGPFLTASYDSVTSLDASVSVTLYVKSVRQSGDVIELRRWQ